MKSLILTTSLLFGSISAFAGTCNLDKPIQFGGELLNGVQLKNVVLDETPKFMPETGYNSAKNVLDVYLFNIDLNGSKTGFIGSQISVVGKLATLGFSDSYSGNFQIQGTMKETNGVRTYNTKQGSFYTEPQHAKNEAITQTAITVSNGKIIALNLMFPIFKVWKTVDGVNYIAFTGDHQTICVKSAQ